MKLIAHRGNINGPNPDRENTECYILEALSHGFMAEVDVWVINNQFYLGHDRAEYQTSLNFLANDNLICHAKNLAALERLLKFGIHCFYHQNDDATLTSRGIPWLYPGNLCDLSIIVMPEWESINYGSQTWLEYITNIECYGVCTDYPIKVKNCLNS